MIVVAVIASLIFIGWIIYRLVRGKPFRAHHVANAVACVAGVYTYAFFLSMNIPQLIQIVVSIILGMVLIVIAAYVQRRRQPDRP